MGKQPVSALLDSLLLLDDSALFLFAVCQVESRFVGHRYLANATRSLEADLVTDAGIYVNWNNMAAHWYYPSVNGSGQLNHEQVLMLSRFDRV